MIAQVMNKTTSEGIIPAATFKEGARDTPDSKHSMSAESDAESSDSGEQTLQTSEFSEPEYCDPTFHSNSLPFQRRRRRRRRSCRLNDDFSDESDQWSLSDSLPSSQQQQHHHQEVEPLMPAAPIACVECSVILLEDVDVKSISLQTALETWFRELRCYTELDNPNILISKTLASCR
ncbi:hypothetical protein SprV_0301069900 [Sparganum proliferum]